MPKIEYIGADEVIGASIEQLMREGGVSGDSGVEGDYDVSGDDVSGTEEIGGRKARMAQRGQSGRKYTGYLGFGPAASVLTTASNTFSDVCQRDFKPSRLLIVAATGIQVDSVKVGDEDLIVGSKSIAAEMFSATALMGEKDDMPMVRAGITVSVKVTNPTAGTIAIAAGMRGDVIRAG